MSEKISLDSSDKIYNFDKKLFLFTLSFLLNNSDCFNSEIDIKCDEVGISHLERTLFWFLLN